MISTETELPGAYRVELKRLEDERGFFARSFCRQEFTDHGLDPCVAQCNVSYNRFKGTLRGMHFQLPPHEEAKLVRCTRGAIYDVILDLRPASGSYLCWIAVELTAENRIALYVPRGFAHGFQTLEDDTEVFYQMSEFFAPDFARGFHYSDPDLAFPWPLPVSAISDKDRQFPSLSVAASEWLNSPA